MGFSEEHKLILQDHYRNPRNKSALSSDVTQRDNPSCGDRVALKLEWEDDRVSTALFDGEGCSISMASASIMTEILKGKNRDELKKILARVRSVFSGEEESAALEALGDMAAFRELLDHPVRLKCAALAWDTLELLLEETN